MILCLETATPLCSVALCDDAGIVAVKESNDGKSHASLLTIFIDELLKEAGIKPGELEAIAVSKGPGSYTGLRIGVSVAKGMAFATSVPLIGIETTLAMFHGMRKGRNEDQSFFYCPMLDARRLEVYYAVYDSSGRTIKEISAEVINEDSFKNFPEEQQILLFGDGAPKLKNIIKNPGIIIDDSFRISASHLFYPSRKAFNEKRFEDIAYFEPLYLKDFITTIQKKNILG